MLLWKKFALLLPWKRRARELSLDEELRSHMELAATDALAEGATPEEAKFAARRDLGSRLRIREDAQGVWGFAALDQFFQDIRFEMRQLKRKPGFTAVAILTLALGAGANALMFTVIDSVLLRPLPFPDSHQLVYIDSIQPDGATVPHRCRIFWISEPRADHSRAWPRMKTRVFRCDCRAANPSIAPG